MAGKRAYNFTREEMAAALEQAKGVKAHAAKILGCNEMTFARHWHGEIHYPPPEGHDVIGTSTFVKMPDGGRQWVKTKADKTQASIIEGFKAALGPIPPITKIAPPKRTQRDLLTCYPMGDPHIGMYAWGEEAGEDFDLDIAERLMLAAADRLVHSAPPTDHALIVNLGDFFHADTLEGITLKSHNRLDVDTRWHKVLRVGIRIMRQIIETALTKHKTVRVINEIGNHDEHTSHMLTLALGLLYERNPRVSFDKSPRNFHYHRFGKNLIGVTHGDKVKPEALAEIMAAQQPKDWGETVHRYWFTGHVHHRRLFELRGCTVESFRTLAPRDAWHSSMAYMAGRDMQAIILHREDGEIERHLVNAKRALKRAA